jgi:hypothetical protein
MLRVVGAVGLVVLLSGCAWIPSWVPWIGADDEQLGDEVLLGRQDGPGAGQGPCRTDKGERRRPGTTRCENDVLIRCFPDGEWHVVGSC